MGDRMTEGQRKYLNHRRRGADSRGGSPARFPDDAVQPPWRWTLNTSHCPRRRWLIDRLSNTHDLATKMGTCLSYCELLSMIELATADIGRGVPDE